MKSFLSSMLFLLVLAFSTTASASPGHCEPDEGKWGTPDTCTPSREDPCEHWKSGSSSSTKPYGLCVAYCEAQDCDSHNANKKSCRQLEKNLHKLTGTHDFACGGEYDED